LNDSTKGPNFKALADLEFDMSMSFAKATLPKTTKFNVSGRTASTYKAPSPSLKIYQQSFKNSNYYATNATKKFGFTGKTVKGVDRDRVIKKEEGVKAIQVADE